MADLCETVLSGPPMDVAIFAVHAHESRLSINEDNAGIGYAKFYRALLQAAGDRVIVVIGGDDNYKGPAEEEKAVLSRWAKRQISSQFKEEFIDGQKSFIFSWDKKHRAIHEEALLHFLDPAKKGKKFVYEPKQPPVIPSVDTNQSQVAPSTESDKAVVKAKSELHSSNVQSMESEIAESHPLAEFRHVPETAFNDQSVGREEPKLIVDHEHAKDIHADPKEQYSTNEAEAVTYDKQLGAMVKDTSSQETKVAILCRDQSDITIISDLFGEQLLSKVLFFSGRPDAGPISILPYYSVRSCFIVVDAKTMEEELYRQLFGTPYLDLLREAGEKVEKKVVVIICNDKNVVPRDDEDDITRRINLLLGDKGEVFLWRGNKSSHLENTNSKLFPQLYRAQSLPGDATAKRSMESRNARPINPETSTLLLKTRLRDGVISYQKEDVEERLGGWTAPKDIEDKLMKEWRSTGDVELLIFRENGTENDLVTIVKEGYKIFQLTDRFKNFWQNVNVSDATSCLPFFKNRKRDLSPSDDLGLD